MSVHGESEGPRFCCLVLSCHKGFQVISRRWFQKDPDSWRLLREAVGVGTDPKAIDEAVYKATFSDILILDSISDTVPGVGAAGVTHDWDIDAEILRRVNVPVVEAGGLGPDNVAAAIEKIHPWAVDSLTKTSIKENGVLIRKDIEKVREFCRIAHQY